MSLIEGIGDDLLYALGFLVFIGIVSLAWVSTRVNHIPFPSTLFIIERRTRRRNEEDADQSTSSPSPMHEPTPSNRQDQPIEHEPSDIESSEVEETLAESASMPTASSNESQTPSASSEEPTLRLVIKFLNETQKAISARPDDTISKIKQSYFATELANNQMVRFIYQGRELQDRETLRTCNIQDQTVIHCQISTRRSEPPRPRSDGHGSTTHIHANTIDAAPVNISSQFVLLLTLILGFIWYLRIKYRLLFSPISTIILILVTIIFLIFTCGSLLSTRRAAGNGRTSTTTIAITPIQHVHLD